MNLTETAAPGQTTPLIHVGYPKTGSTWLQGKLFSDESLGFYQVPRLEALEALVFHDAMEFDVGAAGKIFAPHLQAAEERRLVPVISNEVLVGDQTQGRYWGAMVAERLRETFPEARVLLVFREQAEMVASAYGQHIRVGGRSSLDAFLKREPGFDCYCRMDFLEYDRMVGRYQELFGAENILALPFEMLRGCISDFASRIFDFIGLPTPPEIDAHVINAGFGALTLEIRRRLNRFLTPWTYFDGPRPPLGYRAGEWASNALERILPHALHQSRERRLKEIATAAVGERFAESNRRTSEMIGIDLASYGYPVSASASSRLR